jgi:hypothetical protein
MIKLSQFGGLQAGTPRLDVAQAPKTAAAVLGGLAQVAEQFMGMQEQKAMKDKAELDKSRDALKLAEYSNALNLAKANLHDDVLQGVVKPEEATATYQDRIKKTADVLMSDVTDEDQKRRLGSAFQVYGLQNVGEVSIAQNNYVKMDKEKNLAQISQHASQLFRTNPKQAEAFITSSQRELGPQIGMKPDEVDRNIYTNATNGWLDYGQNAIFHMDSIDALNKERARIESKDTDYKLTNDGRLSLLGGIDARIKQINALQKAEVVEQQSNDAAYLQMVIDQAKQGLEVNAEARTKIREIYTRGDEKLKSLSNQANLVAEIGSSMGNMTVPAMNEALSSMQRQYAEATDPVKKRDAGIALNAAEQIIGRRREQMIKNPYALLDTQTKTKTPPIDFTSPNIAGQLQARRSAQVKASALFGVSVPMFSDKEASEAVQVFKDPRVPAQQIVDIAKTFATASYSSDPDVAKFSALSPEFGAIIAAESQGASYRSQGSMITVSNTIAEGYKLSQDKDIKKRLLLSDEKQVAPMIDKVFNDYMGDAYGVHNPIVTQQNINLAETILLSLSSKQTEVTQSKLKELAKTAIGLATGGVVEYNGQKVVTPYGMNNEAFQAKAKDALTYGVFAMKASEGRKSDVFANARLVLSSQTGKGAVYSVYIGTKPVVQDDNMPLEIRINK